MIASMNSNSCSVPAFLVVSNREFEEINFLKTLHQLGSVLIRNHHQILTMLHLIAYQQDQLNITDVIVDITGIGREAVRLCQSLHTASKGCVPLILYSQHPVSNVASLLRSTRAQDIAVGNSISPMLFQQLADARAAANEEVRQPEWVKWNELVLYTDRYYATLHGRPINLKVSQFKILLYLVTHRGHVVSRQKLNEIGYGRNYREKDCSGRGIDNLMSRLRQYLGDYRSHVKAVRRVGYQFIGDHGAGPTVTLATDRCTELIGYKDRGFARSCSTVQPSTSAGRVRGLNKA